MTDKEVIYTTDKGFADLAKVYKATFILKSQVSLVAVSEIRELNGLPGDALAMYQLHHLPAIFTQTHEVNNESVVKLVVAMDKMYLCCM